LILDEPTTSLDVTTQAVILDLVRELIRETGAAALYVSHDLGLIARLCQRVTVLYGGEVMASDEVARVYHGSVHPYTIGLLASLPRPVRGQEVRLPTIDGTAPALADRPAGCVFAARCPVAVDQCFAIKPALEQPEPGQWIKCHRWRAIASGELAIPAAPILANAVASRPADDGYVLETRGLTKVYDPPSRIETLLGRRDTGVQALIDGSIRIRARSTLGLVGESGSGKTTMARLIVGLETADGGDMELLGVPLPRQLRARTRAQLRELQMVFQNPNDALNPFRTVGAALARTIQRLDPDVDRTAIAGRVADLLRMVRLPPEYADRYPAELSGGEKQRVAIARAFAADPALVIADEPTSALDVSVQAVILNLLKDLRAARGASYLFISHDLNAVSYLADWIVVLYLGEIVEMGDSDDVYNAPSHPYTEALVSAIPVPDPLAAQKPIRLAGELPGPRSALMGCCFHTRCPRKLGPICEMEAPPFRDAGDGHFIRCHIPIDELVRLQSRPHDRTPEGT
ncbi:MAG: ATP-binding cassette domain-containing protein, partial [Anaerolinea sp.]|nr:ATP-binding cassette domain-containing protein [Anaerolinea sp.]